MIEVIALILFFVCSSLFFVYEHFSSGTVREKFVENDSKMFDFDQVVCVDCDDTLVIWPDNRNKNYIGLSSHIQPYEGAIGFKDPYDGSTNWLTPHQKHIDLMKKYKGRGFLVIVWSAGGVHWANSVVDGLGIRNYVDIILTKPNRYVDDLACEKWMGNRVYIK